ncbi:MAG: YlxR family protein [Tissierellia bacterium]|nr:YlxR family protein [Tissierellia bacterium]
MKTRKVPQRKCVVCQQHKAKKDLLRIVKDKEGNISIDTTGKLNGRGAYICTDEKCFEKLSTKKILNQALKTNISEEIYQEIGNYVKMR